MPSRIKNAYNTVCAKQVFFSTRQGTAMTYTGGNIPKLGFGFMRLPVIEGDESATIDIEQVKRMVDVFMGAGFT